MCLVLGKDEKYWCLQSRAVRENTGSLVKSEFQINNISTFLVQVCPKYTKNVFATWNSNITGVPMFLFAQPDIPALREEWAFYEAYALGLCHHPVPAPSLLCGLSPSWLILHCWLWALEGPWWPVSKSFSTTLLLIITLPIPQTEMNELFILLKVTVSAVFLLSSLCFWDHISFFFLWDSLTPWWKGIHLLHSCYTEREGEREI